MASRPGRRGYSHSDSNTSVDLGTPGPSPGTDGFQLRSVESPSGVTSETSAGSRGKAMTPSPNLSALNSRRTSRSEPKQKSVKPRRVRTGCLTCRERHLKCDEALYRCQNCRKSGRVCRRGIRLNFMDTQTAAPYCIARPQGAQITFRDDSRLIASEYVGGLERYPPLQPSPPLRQDGGSPLDFSDLFGSDLLADPDIMMDEPFLPAFDHLQSGPTDILFDINPPSAYHTSWPGQTISHSPFTSANQVAFNSCRKRIYLSGSMDTLFLQTFVEEVGCWIDSMDSMKHFTQILPFCALEHPMIKNTFKACGARHLYLTTLMFNEDMTFHLYDEASQNIINSLQHPVRDSEMCAAAAVALNVYEAMCPTMTHGMNHSAGARALIKECGWGARTPGLGGACFWFNISLELLNCLRFNWKMSWDPDTWGVDMSMDNASLKIVGDDELWIYRIIYTCAKISDFRASTVQQQVGHPENELNLNERFQEWDKYNNWCDLWQESVPRSMMPLSYVAFPGNSAFPEIWLVKRSAIIARLFYHTARILLTKTHPLETDSSLDMQNLRQCHARDICGIIARMKDRGIASFPIWFLIIGAECLIERKAQEEALDIVNEILKGNPFRVEFIQNGLREAWGWTASTAQKRSLTVDALSISNARSVLDSVSTFSTSRKVPSRIVNPTMVTADFGVDGHPYQSCYVPPLDPIEHLQYGNF